MDNSHQVPRPHAFSHDDDDQQVHNCSDYSYYAHSKPASSGAIKGKIMSPHHKSENMFGSELLP